jgi:hypothetical protein
VTTNNLFVDFNSLYVISRELGVLIPGYDSEFMSSLCDLYDCGTYSQRRRTHKINIQIPNAQINLLAATTPSYLSSFLPEGAWQQGFTSRTFFVYSGAAEPKDVFSDPSGNGTLFRTLTNDLTAIAGCYGKLEFTPEAAHTIKEWHFAGGPPVPEHPRLASYCARRTQHVLKLSMVAAMARSDFYMTIELQDFQTALNWLVEIEEAMPDIFRAMRSGSDNTVIDEISHFVFQIYAKEKKIIQEHRVVGFAHERTPSHNVMKLLDLMVKSKYLVYHNEAMGTGYTPGRRRVSDL